MALDPDVLLNWPFPELKQSYTERDTMLYALGVGLGQEPIDLKQLRFVYEDDLMAMPSQCVVLGTPGFWVKDPATGITWQKLLHGEQGFELHKPLPASGNVVARNRVCDLIDKGEGKGALIYVEREIIDADKDELLATLTSTYFCRADGGFGRSTTKPPLPVAIPDEPADELCELKIDPRAALIYRLSGDYNPIHADPRLAEKAGFERPILHGLGSLGVATHAIVRTVCDYEASRLRALSLRFSAPVYPGERLETQIWHRDGQALFRCRVPERCITVIDNGIARFEGMS